LSSYGAIVSDFISRSCKSFVSLPFYILIT
jgi:hypothetical protein